MTHLFPRKPQAARTPEEEGDYMAFEQLVAEAAMKKDKKEKEKDKKDDKAPGKKDDKSAAAETAANAPNVPEAGKS